MGLTGTLADGVAFQCREKFCFSLDDECRRPEGTVPRGDGRLTERVPLPQRRPRPFVSEDQRGLSLLPRSSGHPRP